eukprot:CFRG8092T1
MRKCRKGASAVMVLAVGWMTLLAVFAYIDFPMDNSYRHNSPYAVLNGDLNSNTILNHVTPGTFESESRRKYRTRRSHSEILNGERGARDIAKTPNNEGERLADKVNIESTVNNRGGRFDSAKETVRIIDTPQPNVIRHPTREGNQTPESGDVNHRMADDPELVAQNRVEQFLTSKGNPPREFGNIRTEKPDNRKEDDILTVENAREKKLEKFRTNVRQNIHRGRKTRNGPSWLREDYSHHSVFFLREKMQSEKLLSNSQLMLTELGLGDHAIFPSNTHLEAVVVYMTHPTDVNARKYIRDTITYTYMLGEYKHVPAAFYFVCGSHYLSNNTVFKEGGVGESKSLGYDAIAFEEEAKTFNDIIVLDQFEEDYFRLTEKTAATIRTIHDLLRLANTTARWYIKIDTDACVDHAVLLRTLSTAGARSRVGELSWIGMLYKDVPTRPGNNSKWNDHFYAPTLYPPYMNGPLYGLTWPLVNVISERHQSGKLTMYANEDAAVGVWLHESNINPSPVVIRFPQWVERKYFVTPAVCWELPIVVHGCWSEKDHVYYRSRQFCSRTESDLEENKFNITRIGNTELMKIVLGAKTVVRPDHASVNTTYTEDIDPKSRSAYGTGQLQLPQIPKHSDTRKNEESIKRDNTASIECERQGFKSWTQCRRYLREMSLL